MIINPPHTRPFMGESGSGGYMTPAALFQIAWPMLTVKSKADMRRRSRPLD